MDQRAVPWDASQTAVLAACVPGARLSVVGGPGSGKTTLLRECVVRALRDRPQARIAVVSPDRRAAGELRNALSVQTGGLGERVSVRSISAFAFSILSLAAQREGRREPELISGPEEDAILKDLFVLAERGLVPGLGEAEFAQMNVSMQTVQLPAFRAEIRDLITRAAELGISASQLRELGESWEYARPEWVVGAAVMERYESALATQASAVSTNPDRVDVARLINQAAATLEGWEDVDLSGSGGKLNVPRPHWDLVVVDDVHNATLALRQLLRALIHNGSSVVTFGNPDQAVQSYRGGIYALPVILSRDEHAGGIGAIQMILDGAYRGGREISALCNTLLSAVPTAGVSAHRHSNKSNLLPVEAPSHVHAVSFPNDSEEIAYVAATLRELHYVQGIPYAHMAVLTRSHGIHTSIRSSLTGYGIPTIATQASMLPLREQPAVAGLFDVIRMALWADNSEIDEKSDSEISEQLSTRKGKQNKADATARVLRVLGGKFHGIDPVRLRMLSRQIRTQALVEGVTINERDIWNEFSLNPHSSFFSGVPELAPFRAAINAVRSAYRRDESAQRVLWAAWDALSVAEHWRQTALSGGVLADQAHTDLDAVIQLFRVAQRLEEQNPRAASITNLIHYLESQDLPEDSVAVAGIAGDAVTLATPATASGRSWAHVIVMGLNEGTWPNTRLRNPLTHVPELVSSVVSEILGGSSQAASTQLHSEVIADEMRMLVNAVSRAEESVTLTCIDSDEQMPSRFIEWLSRNQKTRIELTHIEHTVNVPGADQLVSDLRRALRYGDSDIRRLASGHIKRLSHAGVPGADPYWWVDQLEPTQPSQKSLPSQETTKGQTISVSPSLVETTLECPLRAFLDSIGGQDADRGVANLGILVHSIAQNQPRSSEKKLVAELEERWDELGLESGSFEERSAHEQARAMMSRLAEYENNAPEGVLIEQWARGTLDDIAVNARIDRLEFDPNHPQKVQIADLKTGKNPPKNADMAEHPQMLIYQWLVNQQPSWHSTGAHLVYLRNSNGKSPIIRAQQESGAIELEKAERMIRTAAAWKTSNNFAALGSGSYCTYCSYRSLCPAQEGRRIFS